MHLFVRIFYDSSLFPFFLSRISIILHHHLSPFSNYFSLSLPFGSNIPPLIFHGGSVLITWLLVSLWLLKLTASFTLDWTESSPPPPRHPNPSVNGKPENNQRILGGATEVLWPLPVRFRPNEGGEGVEDNPPSTQGL